MFFQIEQILSASSGTKNIEDGTPESFIQRLINLTWDDVLNYIPILLTGFAVIGLSIFIANLISKAFTKFLRPRIKNRNVLIAEFFGHVIWAIVFMIGFLLACYIWGIGNFYKEIFATGALTTLIASFALKDIFENFLSGLIIAFDPPFELGSTIEIKGLKGKVTQMKIRETLMKTADGRDIYVPNSFLIKNSLQNYTIDDFLRKEFEIAIDMTDNLDGVLDMITDTLKEVKDILNVKGKKPKAVIKEIKSGSIIIQCKYWYNVDTSSRSDDDIQNDAIIQVINAVRKRHYMPSDIVEVKFYGNQNNTERNVPIQIYDERNQSNNN